MKWKQDVEWWLLLESVFPQTSAVAWGCQRVGESMYRLARRVGARLTCSDHRKTSPAMLWQAFFFFYLYTPQQLPRVALPFPSAWCFWGIICPIFPIQPRYAPLQIVLSLGFFSPPLSMKLRVWERTASCHLQRVTHLTPADKQRRLITTHAAL